MGDGEGRDTAPPAAPGRAELIRLLARDPLLASLGAAALDDLVAASELIEIPGGVRLVSAEQRFSSLFAVVHGGLRLVRRTDDGLEATVSEFYRGETIGVMTMFVDGPANVDVVTIRDSTLLRLPRDRFLAVGRRHPDLLVACARVMGQRTRDLLEMVSATAPRSRARTGNIALLPVSLASAQHEALQRIIEALAAAARIARVTAQGVDARFGAGAADDPDGRGAQVAKWLSDLEDDHKVLLYECDPGLPHWTARCVRQSDRVVIVATPGSEVETSRAILRASEGGVPREIDLVLLHPADTALPSGTRSCPGIERVTQLHHVRRGAAGDVDRVVRRLVGRPIGLVLSGGGARGVAHLGVMAALVEARVPIDYVCGTSMGAIFAAAAAIGWTVERARAAVDDLFARPFSLYDPTLPVSSLLAGRKLDRVMQRFFGAVDIEDLWLPFFCVSTDLARAKQVVHDRGSLWRAVRASCSIPGIFPPHWMDGRVLVDGGVMNNLPLDLLAERCPGPIIAVDVLPYGEPTFERPSHPVARWLRELRTWIRREPASPPLFDILVRSALVGSKFRQEAAMQRLESIVYLAPPVASFGVLQWRSHRELYDVGYRYACEELLRQPSLLPRI